MKTRFRHSILLASLIVGVSLSLAVPGAYAQGLSQGTSAVSSFELWAYGVAGTLAILYLLWVGIQCWTNKADWVHDFGGAVAKVAAVGAVSVLAPWAWTLFTG